MILLGNDWYELLRAKMTTVERFMLYAGQRPSDPNIVPWVSVPSGVVHDAVVVPQTPHNYSIINHYGLHPFYRVFDSGKVHVSTAFIQGSWNVKIEKLEYPNHSGSSLSIEYLEVDTNIVEQGTIRIKEVDFSPDGLLLTVLTSVGTDLAGNNHPAIMRIYTLQEPYTIQGSVKYSEHFISSGAGFLDGLPYPSGIIWSSGGNISYIVSNNTIFRYFLLHARDFRTSIFGSTVTSFDLSHIGNIHSFIFFDNGNKVLMLEGGYTTDTSGQILLDSNQLPVWTPPRLIVLPLAEQYNPFTIINSVESSFDLTYLFSQYQNSDLVPNLFYMSFEESTNYLYITGVDGVNETKTVVLELSTIGVWDAGADNGESDLIVDLSTEFHKISITEDTLVTNFAPTGLELYLDRKPHEIVKKQVERAGTLSFFYLKTKGLGGSLWISGSIGLTGSGEDIEVNRVVVSANDQLNLNNLKIKFNSIRVS